MKDMLIQLCNDNKDFKEQVESVDLSFDSNHVLLIKDQPVNYIYLIKEGYVRVASDPNRDGPDVAFCILGRGDIFGEMSLFSDQPASAQVTTISQVDLVQFDKVKMERYFDIHPSIGYHFLKFLLQTMGNRVRQANNKIQDLFLWGGSMQHGDDMTNQE